MSGNTSSIIINPAIRQSPAFQIDPGKQITLHATGLQDCDQVIVEVLALTRAGPTGDWCCNTSVGPTEVTEAVPLRCRNGARVVLTKAFPWATLDSPQLLPLRVRVIADDLAQITVSKEETTSTGCGACACVEPYSASYPLPAGGFGFMDGDLKDCEATVAVNPCDGNGPEVWVYPTPRPLATAPVYNCGGEVLGYAPNQSQTAIAQHPTVPCAR
jgi:hypothetical protein